MLGSFQTLVGSNVYGNIYASGIDGIGIQIRDLVQSSKAVPYSASMTSGDLLYWSTDKKLSLASLRQALLVKGRRIMASRPSLMLITGL